VRLILVHVLLPRHASRHLQLIPRCLKAIFVVHVHLENDFASDRQKSHQLSFFLEAGS
jgi:hypothetical protein